MAIDEVSLKKLEQENAQLKALMSASASALATIAYDLKLTAKRLQGSAAACTANAKKAEAVGLALQKAAGV